MPAKNSIKYKLLLSCSILIILTIFTGTVAYFASARIIEKKLSEATLETLEQVNRNVEKEYEKINIYTNMLITIPTISDVLKNVDLYKYDSRLFTVNIELDKLFSTYFSEANNVVSMIILKKDGGIYRFRNAVALSEAELRSMQWFNDTLNMGGTVNWIGMHQNFDTVGNNKYVFSVARAIRDPVSFEVLGVAYMAFDDNLINNGYEKTLVSQNSELFIMDWKGRILTHNDKTKLQTVIEDKKFLDKVRGSAKGYYIETQNGKKYLVSYYNSQVTSWTTVEKIPLDAITKDIKSIRNVVLISLLLSIAVFCFVYIFINRSIVSPVQKLLKAMKKVEEGNLAVYVDKRTDDEIGLIYESFNHMIIKIKSLFESTVHHEREKKRITIEMMQAQINFHFLYNTLNTIKLMAIMRQAFDISDVVTSLAIILQNNLTADDTLITVEEEMEYLRNYMVIQKVRYGDGIVMKQEVDDKIYGLLIPNLLIQPIVENALFHGLAPNGNQGEIKIKGYTEESTLIFEVIDNGVGFEAGENVEIAEPQYRNRKKGSIGIKNVRERIVLLYGEEYGVDINSKSGIGTKVIIKLPIITAKGAFNEKSSICG